MLGHIENQSGDLIRASRLLCLVLSHKPEEAGITLDEHGWADVELRECESPEYLYNGTGKKYADSISEFGLIPKTR